MEYFSLKEAIKILKKKKKYCSRGYLSKLAREKKLKAVKIGNRWMTTERWLKKCFGDFENGNKRRKAKIKKLKIKGINPAPRSKQPYSRAKIERTRKIEGKKAEKEIPNAIEKKSFVLPLYFGYGLKISFNDLHKKIMKRVKKKIKIRLISDVIKKLSLEKTKEWKAFKMFKILEWSDRISLREIQREEERMDERKAKKKWMFLLCFKRKLVLHKIRDWQENSSGWFKKYWQYITVVSLGVVLLVGGLLVYQSLGATYGWTQSSWTGGADTGATYSHTVEQANPGAWTKFYSKDDNVAVGDNLTLSETMATITETTDADFNAGTKDNVYVSEGSVYLKKPLGASCSTDEECADNRCDAGTCKYPWISGSCSGIEVYYKDVSDTKQWKTSQTNCNIPQCGQNGGQNGDNLVADNSVDFSEYPARNACKALGGRLATKNELICIYNHRGEYGFQDGGTYWSSTEYETHTAWAVGFGDGRTHGFLKIYKYRVRCVRGQ